MNRRPGRFDGLHNVRRNMNPDHNQPLVLCIDEPVFPLGTVVATPSALERLKPSDIETALSRHGRCDWGDMSEEARQENEHRLKVLGGVMSVHIGGKHRERFYVITYPGHEVTTVHVGGESRELLYVTIYPDHEVAKVLVPAEF